MQSLHEAQAATTASAADPAPCSPGEYLNRELRNETIAFLRKCLKGLWQRDVSSAFKHNTPEINRSYYDSKREKMRSWTEGMTWDQLVYGNASYEDPTASSSRFVLLGDRIVWSTIREPRVRLLASIERAIADCVAPGGTIVELGSGDGRNLLYLKRRFGDRTFIGLEISPASVKIAQEFSSRYGLPVTFIEGDVAKDLPQLLRNLHVDLVFSCHTLQMMPRLVRQALRLMLGLALTHIVLFEPVSELWPWDRRGIVSRIRCLNADQARGIMHAISETTDRTEWRVTKAERLKLGSSPFTEPSEIRLQKIRPGVS